MQIGCFLCELTVMDAVHDIWIEDTDNHGKAGSVYRYIDNVEVEIGGQKIDKHYGHWHSVYSQLTEFNPSGAAFGGDVGGTVTQGTLYQKMSGNGNSIESENDNDVDTNMGGWLIDSNADCNAIPLIMVASMPM